MNKIKVLIAVKQAIIRDGLFMILKEENDFELTGSAGDTNSLATLASSQKPDVILLDTELLPNGGIKALELLNNSCPSSQVIMLSSDTNEDYIIDCIKKGITGYVMKNVETEYLLYSIRQCVNGHIILPSIIQKKLILYLHNGPTSLIPIKLKEKDIILNDREQDILNLLSEGQTNEQIAQHLFLSIGTVKNYVSQLYRKFKVSNRSELIAYVYSFMN